MQVIGFLKTSWTFQLQFSGDCRECKAIGSFFGRTVRALSFVLLPDPVGHSLN